MGYIVTNHGIWQMNEEVDKNPAGFNPQKAPREEDDAHTATFSAVGTLHFTTSKQPAKAKAKMTSSIDPAIINVNTLPLQLQDRKSSSLCCV